MRLCYNASSTYSITTKGHQITLNNCERDEREKYYTDCEWKGTFFDFFRLLFPRFASLSFAQVSKFFFKSMACCFYLFSPIFRYLVLSVLLRLFHFRKWIIWEDIEKTFSKKYASKSSLDYALACLSPKR